MRCEGNVVKKLLCLVAIMKNERDYVLEWVAYYKTIGIQDILIYDNDSTDGTSELLEKLTSANLIKSKRWIVPEGQSPQMTAYNHAITTLRDDYEFIALFDADEFLVPLGGVTINAYLDAVTDDVGAIAINQRVFGSSGHKNKEAELVTSRFRQAASSEYKENLWVKSIYRASSVDEILSPHHGKLISGRYIQPDGRDAFSGERVIGVADRVDFSLFQVNHYIIKSEEEFLIKRRRGGGAAATHEARVARYEDMNFFHGRDQFINTDLEQTITASLPKISLEIRRLQNAIGGFTLVSKKDLASTEMASKDSLLADSTHILSWIACPKETVSFGKSIVNIFYDKPLTSPFRAFYEKNSFSSEAVEFFCFENVIYHNNSGAVQFPAGKIWQDSAAGLLWSKTAMNNAAKIVFDEFEDTPLLPDSYTEKIALISEDTVILSHASYTDYNHFIFDCCTSLYPFLSEIVNGKLKVVTSPLWFNWQKDLLNLLGIPQTAVTTIRAPTKLKRAIVSSNLNTSGTRFPNAIAQQLFSRLRIEISASAGSDFTPRRPFIYLKQSDNKRTLSDEARFEQALTTLGFVTIEAADISVREQIAILSEARMVVGVYGTALANIVFCCAGCYIFEIRPDVIEDPSTMNTSARFHLNYAGYVCESEIVAEDAQYQAKSLSTMRLTYDLHTMMAAISDIQTHAK